MLFFNTMKPLLLFALLLISISSYSQLRRYGTTDYIEFLKTKEASEKPFSGEKTEIKLPITLSITFVMLTKNVSKEQLLKQIQSLNQDFSNQTFELSPNKSPYYQKLATDTDIRFCENFEVLEAFSDTKTDFINSQDYVRKFNQTNPNNILVFVGSLGNMAGYAQMPGYNAETDAIFIDKDYVLGASTAGYTNGKTLTHLMGTYLGLGELWGCVDDGVFDTPLMSVEHYDHEGSWSSCYNYVIHTMPQNFMYNTEDKYLNMFTTGQKQRMLLELSTRRKSLHASQNCK